jgi:hypothetical protein
LHFLILPRTRVAIRPFVRNSFAIVRGVRLESAYGILRLVEQSYRTSAPESGGSTPALP